ncbi:hypothetical protein BFJ68_g4538 [Fusarium oxysporum]|uniref:Uncharacterized protein n=1 Tax=Fusarium oxysporum TaxID=5507 RepID=A0A420PCH4_FUSOX|nr:hypothetical protein BFJ71_g11756 [Fusarium oxysporum]RKL17660.1 hypothetical protein BFJ68_g4538 [Fusarium oxysporum]
MPSLNSWWWRFLENYVYAVPEPPPRKRTKPMEVLCVGLPSQVCDRVSPDRAFEAWMRSHLSRLGHRRRWFGSLGGNTTITKEEFDEVLGHSVAVTDAAGSVFAAELIAAYPDAKVVLNYRRDLDAWHESAVKTLVSVHENWALYILPCLGKVPFWGWHVYERFMWPVLFRALDGNIETGIARNGKWVYKEHCNVIRDFVPKEKLLEWTIDDGWEPLCKFLDKPVPDGPFPHVNKASGWENHEAEVTKRYLMSALSGVAVLSAVGIATGAIVYKTMWWMPGTDEKTNLCDSMLHLAYKISGKCSDASI